MLYLYPNFAKHINKGLQVAARITGDKPLFEVNVEKNIADILDEGAVGVSSKDIDAVIFSHHHWVRNIIPNVFLHADNHSGPYR